MKKEQWEKFEYDKQLHELVWEIRAISYMLEHLHFTHGIGFDRACHGLGRILRRIGNRVKSISIELQKIKDKEVE